MKKELKELRDDEPVFSACIGGNMARVQEWLIRADIDINITTKEKGYTLLHLAVLCGRMELAELFVKSGINVFSRQKVSI